MFKIDFEILKADLQEASNVKKLMEIKNVFVKKYLTPLYEELKKAEDKKTFGQALNEAKQTIDNITNEYINNLELKAEPEIVDDMDMNLNLNVFKLGNEHILNLVVQEIAGYLETYNFALVSGNELTVNRYNFDALNISADHPARATQDSFYLNSEQLLRTHCTSTSALFLEKNNKSSDIRVFSYGNVYRRDEDDATHSHQFTQIDFVWVKPNLSLVDLRSLIDGLLQHFFNCNLKTRYRLSYFPFTEPSFEVDIECLKCNNSGCNICKQTGWIEVLGAGMLNQEVIKFAGITNIHTGIASGLGVERLAMLKYGITDIRDFYNNDFAINRQYKH